MISEDWKIPEPAEDGVELNYFFNAIVFDDFNDDAVEMLLACKSDVSAFDFARIVPPPQTIADIMAKKVDGEDLSSFGTASAWCEAAWGTVYNAADAKLIDVGGKKALRFTTLDSAPRNVLKKLASEFPNVAWTYYGYDAYQLHAAEGRARDGEFRGEQWEALGDNGLGERSKTAYRMIFEEA